MTAHNEIEKDKDWIILVRRDKKLTSGVNLFDAMDLIGFGIVLELLILDNMELRGNTIKS